MRRNRKAESSFKQTLAIYIALGSGATSSDIASVLTNLRLFYSAMREHSKAKYYVDQASIVLKQSLQGALSSGLANTLQYLGLIHRCEGKDDSKTTGIFREAVHMYIQVEPDNPIIRKIWDILSGQLNHHHRI